MIPTHVIGYGAREYAQSKGWTEATIPDTLNFNPTSGVRGDTEENERIIFVTPGTYTGVSGYLGQRRYVAVLSDPTDPAVLLDIELRVAKSNRLNVTNIVMVDSPIGVSSIADSGPCEMNVTSVVLRGWTKERNGISNPSQDGNVPLITRVRQCLFDSVGGIGNTRHSIYSHGRYPGSLLDVLDSTFLGSRACSQVKTDAAEVAVRYSRFDTRCTVSDYTAHTMLDFASCATAVITGNLFNIETLDPALGKGKAGLQTAAIFGRRRREFLGSDKPAYPAIETTVDGYSVWTPQWDPPETSITTATSPGGGWGAGPETYVADAFWNDVRSFNRFDPNSPFTFKHFISHNKVVGTAFNPDKPPAFLRDDGTMPAYAMRSFGASYILKNHPLWVERSSNFLGLNEISGAVWETQMNLEDWVGGRDPDSLERTLPEHFPGVIHVYPTGLPSWFLQ